MATDFFIPPAAVLGFDSAARLRIRDCGSPTSDIRKHSRVVSVYPTQFELQRVGSRDSLAIHFR
jgi:hypothetical protein